VAVLGPASTEHRFGFAQAGARFLPVEVSDRIRPLRDLASILRLRRLLKGWEVVHAHGLRAGALTALALIGRGRSRLVVTLHNAVIAGGAIGATYAVLERIVARRADVVLAVSSDLVERARRHGARTVERALAPAPPLPSPTRTAAAVREELGIGSRPIVLALGRLAEQKGFGLLLDAAAAWGRADPPPIVLVAGDGPLEPELARRVTTGRLPARLLGRREDVPDLMQAADVLVLPSVWEGQPFVLQEMMRAGRPIVATGVGGIPEMVGDAALLVPSGDAGALAGAVTSVLEDRELAARLAEAARRRAEALPTEEQAVEQVVSVYRRLSAAR